MSSFWRSGSGCSSGPLPARRTLLHSTALLPVAMAFGGSAAQAQAVNIGQSPGNTIIPDGRTATRTVVKGTTTTITTRTLSGGNAFNSFSQFKEGAGNTVNLVVPKAAKNLVNIVRDGAVDIEGTLNSYKNGHIGGNVIFSDSYGFVVGKGGVVNTGALSVVTPKQGVNETVIGSDGSVDNAAAARLIRGDVPLSADGSVMISGRINALHGVHITAHDVEIAGSYAEAAKTAQHRAMFESTVNADGMAEGGAIVARNGSIRIVAAGDVDIAGTLKARAAQSPGKGPAHAGSVKILAKGTATVDASGRVLARTTPGAVGSSGGAVSPEILVTSVQGTSVAGTLAIKAAKDATPGRLRVFANANIDIASTAKFAANGGGTSDAGHIKVKAGGNLAVADGATFDASAGGSAKGGLVELSAVRTASIGRISLNVGSVSGAVGTLLLDPADLVIGSALGSGDPSDASLSPSLLTGGANVDLQADNSITVRGTIDTRVQSSGTATGNSGSVTLTAPSITVASTGQILTQVEAGSTYTPGSVTLNATSGTAFSTQISLAGTVTGGTITLSSIDTAAGGTSTVTVSNALTAQRGLTILGGTVALQAPVQASTLSVAAGTGDTTSATSIALNAALITTGAVSLTSSAISLGASAAVTTAGGNVALTASGTGQAPILAAGASIDTRQRDTGGHATSNAGNITLTALNGAMTAPASSVFQAGVEAGSAFAAGTITLAAHGLSVGSSMTTQGANLVLQSTGALTLDPSATLDTRNAGGASGDLTLAGTSFTNGIPAASQLLAGISPNGGGTAGTITLAADTLALNTNFATSGASLVLQATSSLTIGSSTVIDARVLSSGATAGTSGSITLGAPTLSVSNFVLGNLKVGVDPGASGAFHAGTLTFKAGATLNVDANIATPGESLVLQSAGNLTIGSNTTIDTRLQSSGTATGNAGNVTLSAQTFTNGTPSPANIFVGVNAGSAYSAGTVTFKADSFVFTSLLATHGTAYTISARTIDLQNGSTIDTRVLSGGISTGNSGAVSLTATDSIMMEGGSQILADVINGGGTTYTTGGVTLNAPTIALLQTSKISANGGAINLTADPTDVEGFAAASAVATIGIDGTLQADTITVDASATTKSVYGVTEASQNNPLASQRASWVTAAEILSPLQLTPGYVQSQGISTINLTSHAVLTTSNGTSGSITLNSHTVSEASDPAISVGNGLAIAASVIVGITHATATTDIASGATISTNGTLNISATNNAKLNVSSVTIAGVFGGNSAPVVASVADGEAVVASSATIDGGANITGTGSVSVLARNDNSFVTNAKSYARTGGVAGAALAISNTTATATAHIGADLGQTASGAVGNVTVAAQSETKTNQTSASTTVGQGNTSDVLGAIGSGGALYTNVSSGSGTNISGAGLASFLAATPAGQAFSAAGQASPVKLSGALTLANSQQSAIAGISADTGHAAPTIASTGNVAVLSDTSDLAILGLATSTINAAANPSQQAGALSVGLAINEIGHVSSATIGSGVSIDAARVGVAATASAPSPIQNINWKDFGSVVSGVLADVTVATSGANATSSSNVLGGSGSLDFSVFNNTTTTWIGTDARITTHASDTPSATWQTTDLTALGASDHAATTLTGTVDVSAAMLIETINGAGAFALSGGVNATGGVGVGASVALIQQNDTTTAGVAKGAHVTTKTLDVTAADDTRAIDLAPANGVSDGSTATGLVNVYQLNNSTSASISNLATVQATTIALAATQNLAVYVATGDVTYSGASGAGISVAYSGLLTDTSAFVGDNSNKDPLTETSAATSGQINTDNLTAQAVTTGNDVAGSVAATVTTGGGSLTPPIPSSSKAAQLLGFSPAGQSSRFSLTLSGSASVTDSAISTSAYLDHATVLNLASSTASTSIQALDDLLTVTVSGSAAVSLATAGNTSQSAAIAGAVAVQDSGNATLAYVTNSTLTNMGGGVAVTAYSTGTDIVVGLGLALSPNAPPSSLDAAGSVSFAKIHNRVAAYVDSSRLVNSVAQNASPTGDLSVIAYENTNIGIGGGAFFGGGSAGFGFALTYADVTDPNSSTAAIDAHVSASTITNYRNLSILADSPQRIFAAAASGGYASTGGLAGAFVVAQIDSTTSAELLGSNPSAYAVNLSGDATIVSTGEANAGLVSSLKNQTTAANGGAVPNYSSNVDFAPTSVLGSGAGATGAAILSVAGAVQAGGTNVGFSLVDNKIDQTHEAAIDGVTLTSTGGVVTVTAEDSATILGIAIGVGGSSGGNAGVGSVSYNDIGNAVIARIGHSATATGIALASVEAAAVEVTAEDSSTIRGASGSIAISAGANAVGLSATVDQISNYVSATIAGATVTADETLGTTNATFDSRFSAGSVLLSALSDANILTVSVGAAITVSAPGGSSGADPFANLKTLISSLSPTTRSRSNAVTGAPPPKAFSPPTPPSSGSSGSGSIAVSTEATSAYAAIVGGATGSIVTANNNVGVLASNKDQIAAISGAASLSSTGSGIGASVVVNLVSGDTQAYVDASAVDAKGLGTATMSVDSGVMAHALDPSAVVAPGQNVTLTDGTQSVHGLAINARSQQSVQSEAVVLSASAGGRAIGLNVVTTILGGTVEAYAAHNAQLDTHLTTGAPDIEVTASSASFANVLDIGAAISGGSGAAAAAVVVNTMDRTTYAYLSTTAVGSGGGSLNGISPGAVGVLATSWEGTSAVVTGIAVSDGAGVSGSALVNLFKGDTEASVDGNTLHAGSLSVKATSDNGYFGGIGNAAAGTSAGVGATVIVGTNNDKVTATIGDTHGTATTIDLTGPLTVAAKGSMEVTNLAVGASIGGSAGLAAMLNATLAQDIVQSGIYGANVTIRPANGASGDVSVTSEQDATIKPNTGTLAAGGSAGIGASVNLVLLAGTDVAEISGSTLNTTGALRVAATSARDIELVTATAAVGGTAGLAASAGIVIVGARSGNSSLDTVMQEEGGSLSSADTISSNNNGGGPASPSVVSAAGGGTDKVSATITGGTVTASGVTIDATGDVETLNAVGSLGVGGSVGVGAAVAFTQVDQTVLATATGGTIHTSSLTIDAEAGNAGSGQAVRSKAVAGAGGLYVGVGAAVGVATANNVVSSGIGSTVDLSYNGSTHSAATTVSVTANDTSSVRAEAYGFGAGIAAVGASIASASRQSAVTAELDGSANITSTTVNVTGQDGGETWAYSLGGAGGIVAGSASVATASDTTQINAKIDDNATVSAGNVANIVNVTATGTPDAKAFSFGVSVGAAAIGASVAQATASPHVYATVGGAANLGGSNSLVITATGQVNGSVATSFPSSSALPSSTDGFQAGGTSAASWAIAGAGGALVGIQATVAEATDNADVEATTGTTSNIGLLLPLGDVTITATNTTAQFARGTGVAAGFVGAGAVVVKAESDSTTKAVLGDHAGTSVGRALLIAAGATPPRLTIQATGSDTNNARSQAGSGGVVAGSGAAGQTVDNSTVLAGIGSNSSIMAGAVTLAASHTDNFATQVDSIQAAAYGASASVALDNATSNVTASLGDHVTIASTDTLTASGAVGTANAVTLTANNVFNRTGSDESSKAGAGGVISGAGASSDIELNGFSKVLLGATDVISSGTGGVVLLATSSANVSDTVDLTSGGALAGAGVNDTVRVTLENDVLLADSTSNAKTSIATQGRINLATYASAAVSANALVSTYGLAVVGVAESHATITANQTVTVGQNATLLALGEVQITAGLDSTGTKYNVSGIGATSNATATALGLIGIPSAKGYADANSNTAVNLNAGSLVESARNVTIGAYHGSPGSVASGDGHYVVLGIPASNHFRQNNTTTSGAVTVNGSVVAGLYNTQVVTITGSNTSPVFTVVSGAPVTLFGNSFVNPSNGQSTTGAASPISSTNVATGASVTGARLFDIGLYVQDLFDPEVAQVLAQGVQASGTAARTFVIGQLFASGGIVTINADTLSGSGTLTSHGNATITLTNNTDSNVILAGGAYIPDAPGSQVLFTGAALAAQARTAGITISTPEAASTNPAGITVNLTYTGSAANNSVYGPAFINSGVLSALGGNISLSNANGWFGQLADISASSVNESAPYGGLVVSATSSGQQFDLGDPMSQWSRYQNYPGIAQGAATSFTNTQYGTYAIAEIAANEWLVANNPNRYTSSYSNDIYNLISDNFGFGNPYLRYNSATNLYENSYAFSTNQFDTEIYGHTNFNENNNSGYPLRHPQYDSAESSSAIDYNTAFQFLSNCVGISCNQTIPLSSVSGGYYQINDYGNGGAGINVPVIPVVVTPSGNATPSGYSTALNSYLKTSYTYQGSTTPSVKTFGGPIAIKADIIDINGSISTGTTNDWSLTLDQQTSNQIASFRSTYQAGGATTLQLSAAVQNDNNGLTHSIGATYDYTTNSIDISNIRASSGAGYVLLDGKIISTSAVQAGLITVNGGLGQVTINNTTGHNLVVNDVENGSITGSQPLTSVVKIVDRLAGITKEYDYTPGVGVSTYQANSVASGATLSLVDSSSGTTAAYNPTPNTRYQWVQTATMTRDLSNAGNGSYVGWGFANTNDQTRPYTTTTSLVNNQDPEYQETITTSTHFTSTVTDQQRGCAGTGENICDGGYTRENDDGRGSHGGLGVYGYQAADQIVLTMTNSVKADHQIGIQFNGNANAFLDITSNAAVNLAGTIDNASGTTSVTVNGSTAPSSAAITTGSLANVSTKYLVLSTPGAIGAGNGAFTANISAGGAVKASAGAAGATLAFTGGAAIDSVTSGTAANGTTIYGDVSITAQGSLTAAGQHIALSRSNGVLQTSLNAVGSTTVNGIAVGDTNITGRNVTLFSNTGGIGSAAAPLVVNANATTSALGATLDGVINATANGSIGLTGVGTTASAASNFRVGLIRSTGGDVTINVPNGIALNASGQTSGQSLSDAQLASVKQTLHLTLATGAAQSAIDTSITPFEQSVDAAYTSYTGLLAKGSVSSNGTFTLTAAGSQGYAQTVAVQSDTTYQTLLTNGSVDSSGTFTLSAAGLLYYAAAAATADNVATATPVQIEAYAQGLYAGTKVHVLETLLSKGQVASDGTFTLTADGVAAYLPQAVAALAPPAQSAAITLLANGAVASNGTFTLSNAGVQTYTQAAITALGSDPSAATYTTLLANGTVGGNGGFTLSANGFAYYAAAAATANNVATASPTQIQAYASGLYAGLAQTVQTYGVTRYAGLQASTQTYAQALYTANRPTDAAIQTYASTQYSGDVTLFKQAFATTNDPTGNNWQTGLQGTTVSSGTLQFHLASGSALYQSLTANSVWTDQQLTLAVDQSALQPAAALVGNTATASLVGQNVTINAAGGVGQVAPVVFVSKGDLLGTSTDLTTTAGIARIAAETAALGVATTPGTVVAQYDAQNNLTGYNVLQTQPLYVSAVHNVSASSATGAVLLQGTAQGVVGGDTLRIGRVTAAGDVNLAAPAGIADGGVTTNGPSIVSGGTLTLQAGNGSIGTSAAPVTLEAATALNASATGNAVGAGNVFVKSYGAVTVSRIFADPTSGTASIRAVNRLNSGGQVVSTGTISGVADSGGLAAIVLSGHSVNLVASGDIGSSQHALAISTGTGGALSGSTSGAAYLSSPSVNTQTALTIGGFTSTNDLNVTAGVALSFSGATSSSSGSIIASGLSVGMLANASLVGQAVNLTATGGDVSLGQVVSRATSVGSTPSIRLTASSGAIKGNGDGQVNLVAAQFDIGLTAGTGIGIPAAGATAAQPLSLNAASLSASTASGSILIATTTTLPSALGVTAATSLHASTLTAQAGSVSVTGAESLTLDSVSAGTASNATGSLTATSAGSIAIGTATSRGDATVIAGTNLSITTSLTSLAGNAGLTATTGSITGQGLSAQNLTLNAGANIGTSAGSPLTFVLGTSGLLSGHATGSAWLSSTSAVNVTTLSAESGLTLSTTGALRIETISSTPGLAGSLNGPVTLRGASLAMDSGAGVSAAGAVTLSAAGDITLGHVVSTSTGTSGAVIDIEAGAATLGAVVTSGTGSILSNGDAGAAIQDNAVGVGALLDAGNAVGPLSVSIAKLAATAGTGSLALSAASDLRVTTASAVSGTVDIEGTGTLIVDNATSGGLQTIHAHGSVAFTQLTATGPIGDIAVTSDTSSIAGGSATAHRSAMMTAVHGSNTGGTLTAQTGDALVEGGTAIDWTAIIATLGNATVTADTGNLSVGSVTAGETASLTATTGSILPVGSHSSLTSANLSLTAGQDIGLAGTSGGAATPFGFTLGAGGTLSGSAGGSAWLVGTSGVAITSFTATAFSLETATGDIAVGRVVATATSARPIPAITLKADQGAITSTGAGVNLVAPEAGAVVSLTASTGIGAAGHALSLNAPILSAMTQSGDVVLAVASTLPSGLNLTPATALQATTLASTTGLVDIEGSLGLRLDSVTAGKSFTARSTGSLITIGTAVTGGSQGVHAANGLSFTTLTTNGVAGDVGDVTLTSDTGSITGGSIGAHGSAVLNALTTITGMGITTTTGSIDVETGSLAAGTGGLVQWTSLSAGTTLTAISGHGAITFAATTSGVTSGSTGTQTIHAYGAVGLTTVTAQGGTLGVTSDASTITIGAATSDLTQTLQAHGDLDFHSLTTTGATGDISLTSTLGAVQGTSTTLNAVTTLSSIGSGRDVIVSGVGVALDGVTAARSASIASTSGSNTGASVTATTGNVTLSAGGTGLINGTLTPATGATLNWTSVSALAGTLTATAVDTITLGTAATGGSQGVHAANGVSFTTLTTNGVSGDVGNVTLTSDTGSITGGSVGAQGSAVLTALTTISGTSLTTTTGSIDVEAGSLAAGTGGLVQWSTLSAGTTLKAVSGHGAVTFAAATSGTVSNSVGTQTIHAHGAVGLTTVNVNGGTLGVTSDASSITIGTAASGAGQILRAAQAIGFTRLTASSGDIAVTSDTGSIAGGALDAQGSATLTAALDNTGDSLTTRTGAATLTAGGRIDWTTLSVATTLGATSTGSSVTLGTAASGAAQTLHASGGVGFTQLTASTGDIAVTSDNGSISGGSLDAQGSATLTAALDNTGNSLTTRTGAATLNAGGRIDWTTLSVATTLGATSTGSSVTIGTAASGAGQTLHASAGVGFTQLTASSGDIAVTSDKGSIAGGTLTAQGSATLTAADGISGQSLAATTGSATLLAEGAIDWRILSTAKSLDVVSSGDAVTLGTATSGGSQRIGALGDIGFTRLTTRGIAGDRGDVTLVSLAGDILGGDIDAHGFATLSAQNITFGALDAVKGFTITAPGSVKGASFSTEGAVVLDALGDVTLGTGSSPNLNLSSPTSINLTSLSASTVLNLEAPTISIGTLTQAPGASGPLEVDIGGFGGSLGTSATIFFDAPNGVVIGSLREADAAFTTNASSFSIAQGFVTGTLSLKTATQSLYMNNGLSTPVAGYDVQLFALGDAFSLSTAGRGTFTDAYVVQYATDMAIEEMLFGRLFPGGSLTRDLPRQAQAGDDLGFDVLDPTGKAASWRFSPGAFDAYLKGLDRGAVGTPPGQPAVNVDTGPVVIGSNANGQQLRIGP